MGFSLKKWFKSKNDFLEAEIVMPTEEEIKEYMIRQVAFNSCVNLISKVMSGCEIKTFSRGKEIKKNDYYQWNYKPNNNQSAYEFKNKLFHHLLKDNEVLIIGYNNQLFVADTFSVDDNKITEEYKFTGISVNGVSIPGTLLKSEVLYLKLNNDNVKMYSDELASTFNDLLYKSIDAFKKSKSNRGILSVDTIGRNNDKWKEELENIANNYFKKFYSTDNATIPLPNGFTYTDLTSASKSYSSESTRDIKAQIDDIFDLTAKAFNIPPSLIKGDVQDTEKAMDQLLTTWIKPLKELLEESISLFMYDQDVMRGTKIVIDVTHVKLHDIFDLASNVDKLVASALFSIDDLRKMLGFEQIGEEWAEKHYMTKNYSSAEQIMQDVTNNYTEPMAQKSKKGGKPSGK